MWNPEGECWNPAKPMWNPESLMWNPTLCELESAVDNHSTLDKEIADKCFCLLRIKQALPGEK